jgi:hypothetical protein
MAESSLSACVLLVAAGAAVAQVPDFSRAPLLPAAALTPSEGPATPQAAPNRIRLFWMQPGFVNELPWLDSDDRTPEQPDPEPGPDWISVTMGNDNPYFDFRRPGDPGGVGFARVETQVQLFDTRRTAFAFGLQAVTPLGRQSDGLADNQGPTVVTPALSLYHELDDGLAFQGFVGKNMPLMNSATQTVRRNLQYGLALHRPLSTDAADPLSNLYVSVGALGTVRRNEPERNPLTWELLPGLHWKPSEAWWMSAGYILPVNSSPTQAPNGHWQLTCSWQY